MKNIKTALISFVVIILVLFIAVTVFLKTFNVMRFKPQIINQLNKALNRKVDFKTVNLGMSLKQGITLSIGDLSVSDDAQFSNDSMLTVKDTSLGIDILSYIKRREINVPSVIVNAPKVNLVRLKEGKINLSSIVKTDQGQVEQVSSQAKTGVIVPSLLINSFKITDGAINYIDRAFQPEINLKIKDLDALIQAVSLTKPFPFTAQAGLLSSKQNLKVKGKLGLNLNANEVVISDLQAETDLSMLSLERIPLDLPMLKDASLPQGLSGTLKLSFDKLVAGPKGLMGLSGEVSLDNANARVKGLALPIKDIGIRAKITEDKITIDKTSLAVGQGIITVQGIINDYLKRQIFNIQTVVKDLNLGEVIAQGSGQVKIEGFLSSNLNLNGYGLSQEALQDKLSGKGDISLTKVKIKNINVLRTVLDKISVIPGLAEKVQTNLSEKYKEKLNHKDTTIADIELPVLIEQGKVVISDAILTADEFVIRGQAQVGLSGSYDFKGVLLVPMELSVSMVAAVDRLRYLLNERGEIQIPLGIYGKAPAVNFKVDAEYIAKRMLLEEGKKQLLKVLEKTFEKEEPQTEQTEGEPQSEAQPAQQ